MMQEMIWLCFPATSAERAKLEGLARQKLISDALGAMALVDKGNDVRDSMLTLDGIREIVRRLNFSPKLFSDAANLNDRGEPRRAFLNLSWGSGPDPIPDDTTK